VQKPWSLDHLVGAGEQRRDVGQRLIKSMVPIVWVTCMMHEKKILIEMGLLI